METEKKSAEQNQSDLAVIPFNEDWYWIYKNVRPTTISKIEIERAMVILEKAVVDNNYKRDRNSRFSIGLEGYRKQFVPVLNQKGEKEIWANMFCSDFEADNWKLTIIDVDDGGNCFWSVKINLTTGEYYELSINGYA